MKKYTWTLLFTGMVLVSCTTAYDYYSIRSKTTDMSAYRTYAWLYPNDSLASPVYGNPIAEDIIMGTAKAALSKRGYTVDKEEPDLLVRYTVVVDKQERRVRRAYPYLGWHGWGWPRWGWGYPGWGWSPWYYGGGWPSYTQRYEAGIFGLDFIDRRTKKLVWRGWSEGVLPRDPELAMHELPGVIHQIFEKFPVPARRETQGAGRPARQPGQGEKTDMKYQASDRFITRI